MIRTALVCLEGSAETELAIDLAIETAQQLGVSLVGLAVVDEPDIRSGSPTSIGGASYKKQRDEALLAEAEQQARRWERHFLDRCEHAGVTGRYRQRRGRPAAEILEEMQAHDLTFMGRNTNFRVLTQAEDPGTRDRVLHQARRPVVLVSETAHDRGSPDVLLAYDGSSAAGRAIKSFAESGLHQGRKLHVAAVNDDGATAWDIATRGVALLRDAGIAAETHNIVSALPIADALLELRDRLKASLLVMGAYSRSRLAELVWGSVTHELVQKAPVPLYLHH